MPATSKEAIARNREKTKSINREFRNHLKQKGMVSFSFYIDREVKDRLCKMAKSEYPDLRLDESVGLCIADMLK